MKPRLSTKLIGITLGVVLVLAGASAASAKDDTPGHAKNGKFVPGCTTTELTTESGGSDIVGGTGVVYHAPAGGSTGTFDFTFTLAANSCTELTYRVDVYQFDVNENIQDGISVPIASSQANGDFTSTSLKAPTVVIPSDYTASQNCITVVVRSLNGTTQLDRAPDFQSNDVCDGQGGSQLWR